MIILDATTKSLKIVLAGAVAATQLRVVAHYTDTTATANTPGSNDTLTNSTTVVEFVAAPAASTQRHVESISVYNIDTAPATVTIQYVSAGGTREIIKVILQTLYALYYEHGRGWQVIDANGGIVSGVNVSDVAYAASWDAVTTVAPSKNAVYDQMELKLTDPGAWIDGAWTDDGAGFGTQYTATVGHWHVAEADVVSCCYHILGKKMTVAYAITDSTIESSATVLKILIPGGKTATRAMYSTAYVYHGIIEEVGKVSVSGTTISIQRIDGSAFSNSTNTARAYGQITFEIN